MMRFILLLVALSCTSAQLLPRCPNYQTTVNFTQKFADQMQKRAGGYIVRLSNGATDACQRLQFVDGNDFNVTFIDVANFKRNYTNRHSVKTAESTSPAHLHLTMHPRLFGSDNRGSLKLYPLVARDDMVAFVSCIERGLALFITEQVLVFTPYEGKENLTDTEIKSILDHNKVPRVDELKNISTNCVPKPSTAPHPLSLDLYNLVSNLMNPFGGVSNYAVTYGAPNQNPADAAGQVMSVFKESGVSPAQFYAQTGSTVMQAGAQSYFGDQNPMYYNSQPAYYDSALRVAQSAANAEHFYNSVPGYPTQYHQYQSQYHHNTNPQTPTQAAVVPTNVMSIGSVPHATSHGHGMSAAEYASGNVNTPTGSVQNPSGSVYHPSQAAYNPTSYNQIGKTHYHPGNFQNNIPVHGNYPNNNNFYPVQQTPTGSNQAHYNY